jgi:hypothetical protein
MRAVLSVGLLAHNVTVVNPVAWQEAFISMGWQAPMENRVITNSLASLVSGIKGLIHVICDIDPRTLARLHRRPW